MTLKVRRIRYKRRLIIRPYIALKRATCIRKKVVKTSQAEIVNAISSAEQLSNELASFKGEENPYAYFVSQLPNILSAIPNLLQKSTSEIENDVTNKPITRKSSDDLLSEKLHIGAYIGKIGHAKTSTIQSTTPSDQQDRKTAYTATYKMAGEALTDYKISNYAEETHEKTPSEYPFTAIETTEDPVITHRVTDKIDTQKNTHRRPASSEISRANQRATQTTEQEQRVVVNKTVLSTRELALEPLTQVSQITHPYSPFNYNSAENGPVWLTWKTKQDKKIVDWFSLFNPSRRFLWPGLPEKNCQQLRFGGQKEALMTSGQRAEPLFVFGHLSSLASERKCSVLKLLLLLSPVAGMRQFLAEQALQKISHHCLNMPEISAQKLTLGYYLDHLLCNNLLQPNLCCLMQTFPSLNLMESGVTNADQLSHFFKHQLIENKNVAFKLTLQSQVVFIEVVNQQVKIYNNKGDHHSCSLAIFERQLTQPQFDKTFVSYEVFRPASESALQLASLLQKGEQQWQKHWSRHLYEFIISPDKRIDTTELQK